MPTEAQARVAAKIRVTASASKYHGPAAELVKLFGAPFTEDGVRVAKEALASKGLDTKPPLSADRPNQVVLVVVVGDAPREPQPADSADGSRAAPGWYHDPDAPDTNRYWDGENWTDEWSPVEEPAPNAEPVAQVRKRRRAWPTVLLLILGAAGYWFAQTYKPSASNQLGLNGNTFYLKTGPDHLIILGSIVLLAIGVVRLLMSVGRS